MAVECRFFVSEVGKKPTNGEAIGTVTLTASTKGPHNWSQWTPFGEMRLGTLNAEAMAWFDARLGKDLAILIDDIPEGLDEDPQAG